MTERPLVKEAALGNRSSKNVASDAMCEKAPKYQSQNRPYNPPSFSEVNPFKFESTYTQNLATQSQEPDLQIQQELIPSRLKIITEENLTLEVHEKEASSNLDLRIEGQIFFRESFPTMEIGRESAGANSQPKFEPSTQCVKSRSPTRRICEWSPNPFSPLDHVGQGEEDNNYPEYPSITTEPATSSPLNQKIFAEMPTNWNTQIHEELASDEGNFERRNPNHCRNNSKTVSNPF